MSDIAVAYIVMASIAGYDLSAPVMFCTVTAYADTICIVMTCTAIAFIVMAYIVMAYVVMAHVVTICIVMPCTAITYIVTAALCSTRSRSSSQRRPDAGHHR